MKKYFRIKAASEMLFTFSLYYFITLSPSYALEIKNVSVTDQAGNARSNYTNSEKINFNVKVYNPVAGERVSFKFEVTDPVGAKKFTHTGNSIPGNAGEGGSAVSYVPISNFYTMSGKYTLKVYAKTGASEITGSAVFSVYSPNVTLTYPASGMRDLSDKPLVFRWVASGASKYRIYVDDDAAFFNCLFKDDSAITQYTYPAEPTDVRQKLSAGTVYYWKVDALDTAGNLIAFTPTPFSFTIKSTIVPPAAKDIAVTDISISNQQVAVSIKNQGGKMESAIPVTLYIGGVPQGTINVNAISPGETKVVLFTPNVSGTVVATAMIKFEDDHTNNNMLTKQINIIFAPPPLEVKGSIHGSVIGDSGKLAGIVINYESGMNKGKVSTNAGGEYKIDELAAGEYILTVAADGYEKTKQTVKVEKNPVTNVDFRLTKIAAVELIPPTTTQAEAPRQYNAAQAWDILKKYVKDREVLTELENYEPVDIQAEAEIQQIIFELENGTAKITGVEFKNE